MRAILIDADARTVRVVENEGMWETVAEAIGARRIECFALHTFRRHESAVQSIDLWTDEEADLGTPTSGFVLAGERDSVEFIGNGLIMDCDWHGDTIGTRMPLEAVKAIVTFITFDKDRPAPEPMVKFLPH